MQNEETEKDEHHEEVKKQMAIHGDICGDMNIVLRMEAELSTIPVLSVCVFSSSAAFFFIFVDSARHNEFVTRHDRALLAFESRFRFNPDRNSFI